MLLLCMHNMFKVISIKFHISVLHEKIVVLSINLEITTKVAKTHVFMKSIKECSVSEHCSESCSLIHSIN